MTNTQQREVEVRKFIEQLNQKTKSLIEVTASSSFQGLSLEQRLKKLRDMKADTELLINIAIKTLTEEGYEQNREMIAYCVNNLTTIGEQLDAAIRKIQQKPAR